MRNILDPFGRRVNYLRVSVTRRCNLKCGYCAPANDGRHPADGLLTCSQLIRIISICSKLGMRKVRLTGGEPLTRRDIVEIVREIRAVEGIQEITMTTNGLKLEHLAPALREAGLTRINVSLDTLRSDRMLAMTGYDGVESILSAVATLSTNFMWPVKINMVVIRGFNDDEIVDFATLASRFPIEVRFIEMMPTSGNQLWSERSYFCGDEVESLVRGSFDLIPTCDGIAAGPARVYKISGGAGSVGFISPLSRKFCDDCNRLRLTAEGKLRSCLFSDSEVDLMPGFQLNHPEEWFLERIEESLAAKAPDHGLDRNSQPPCTRPMIAIGG